MEVPHAALRDEDDATDELADDGLPAARPSAAVDVDGLGDGVGEVVGIGGGPEFRHDGSVTSAMIRNEIAAHVQQAFGPAPPADRKVPGDPAHPADRIVERGHRPPLREGTRERLLHQILRVGPVTGERIQLREEARVRRRVELSEVRRNGHQMHHSGVRRTAAAYAIQHRKKFLATDATFHARLRVPDARRDRRA
jgi:hypothetical protein